MGPGEVEARLQRVLPARADELLEFLVRGEDDLGRGDLVDVANLQADDAVLDVVEDPDAVLTGDLRDMLDQVDHPHGDTIDRNGESVLEADREIDGAVGRVLGKRHELEDVVRCCLADVLDDAAFAGAAPEVVVDRVRPLDARADRDTVFDRVGDLLVAAHLPLTNRRDDLQLRGKRLDGRLDPDLVVALAGAAMGDGVAAVRAGDVAGDLREKRPAERRKERIGPLVARVRFDGGRDVVADELLLGIDKQRLGRAKRRGFRDDRVEVVLGLAEVDAQRHDLSVVLVLDPFEHDRRIQSAGVEQHASVHLVWLGQVACSRRWCRVEVCHPIPRSKRRFGAGV